MVLRNKIAIILFLSSLVFAVSISAQNFYSDKTKGIAVADGINSPVINPASPAFGNAAGIGYYQNLNGLEADMERFRLFINTSGLSFLYDQFPGTSIQHLISSFRIWNGVYGGMSFRFHDWSLPLIGSSYGLLLRPHPTASFGLHMEVPGGETPEFTAGLGVRPFAFFPGLGHDHRLTLWGDMPFTLSSWTLPTAGASIEPFNGITANGSYNFEENSFSLDVGLAISAFKGGAAAGVDSSKNISGKNAYVEIGAKQFTSNYFTAPGAVQYRGSKNITEMRIAQNVGPFRMVSNDKPLIELLEDIERLKDDRDVSGIVFKNINFNTSFANLLDIIEALRNFKATGKKVIFYYQNVSNLNYALAASVGDKIFLHPEGTVQIRGFSISKPYLNSFLNKYGIRVDNFRSHEYKSAGNMFSESSMTDAERAEYNAFLEGGYNNYINLMIEGRGSKIQLPPKQIIDEGPYLNAQNALETGLVDELLYDDQFKEKLNDIIPGGAANTFAAAPKIKRQWEGFTYKRVAVIYAVGNIHSGEGVPGESIGAKTTAEAIRRARNDSSVAGIILRVNSGGGSALASDTIGREVELCGKGDNKKPVVVSMAGTAASGGYYISAPADKIVAQPVTLTGSIGVIAIVPHIQELLKEQNITWSVVRKGQNADFGAIYREMSKAEKKKVRESIEKTYDSFIKTVADGRDMDKEEVHKVAQGRIWTGEDAKENGLVDRLGGIKEAMKVMEELLGKEDIPFVTYPQFSVSFGMSADGVRIPAPGFMTDILGQEETLKDMVPYSLQPLYEYGRLYKMYENEEALLLTPFIVKGFRE